MDLLEFAWKLSQKCEVFPALLKNLPVWQHISGINWPTKEEVCVVSSLLLLLSPFASFPFEEYTAYWIKTVLYTACVQLAHISDLRWRNS